MRMHNIWSHQIHTSDEIRCISVGMITSAIGSFLFYNKFSKKKRKEEKDSHVIQKNGKCSLFSLSFKFTLYA